MGGRGASSGVSRRILPNGKVANLKYGSEYYTIMQEGNIKFIKSSDPQNINKAPMETMTKGRVYVYVNKSNQLKNITFFDETNKRNKTIDLDHSHTINDKKVMPHVHIGYEHMEKGVREPTKSEQIIIDKVTNAWYYN